MVLLLPARADGLADLEQRLTPENVTAWLAGLRPVTVQVSVPKFHLTRSVDLKSALFHMGMSLAFGPGADLGGMDNGKEGLYLSAAVHKVGLEVHEEGTEAAAATAAAGDALSRDATPRFTADRSFLFLIRDRRTGCALFLGRLVDPRG
jgi:serine protease inhibitor